MKSKGLSKGFTLAEIMVIFAVSGVIAITSIVITKSKIDATKKFFYFATLTTLQRGASSMLAEGFDDPDTPEVTIEAKLPLKGHYADNKSGFCDRYGNMVNTIGSLSATNCTYTATSNFAAANYNFVVVNGAKYYNMGSDPDANGNYSIYIDINGSAGSTLINDDVLEFTINRTSGVVLPAKDSQAANSTIYLSTAVRYKDGNSKYRILKQNAPYRESFCITGRADNPLYSDYCSGYSTDANCQGASSSCEVLINQPSSTLWMGKGINKI